MNRKEIWSRLPDIIDHPSHGYGELEIVVDNENDKGLCYRHENGTASFGTYKTSWQKIFDDLGPWMQEKGYKIQGL